MESTLNQIDGVLATTTLDEEKKALLKKYVSMLSQPGQLRVVRTIKMNRDQVGPLVSLVEELDQNKEQFEARFEELILSSLENSS